MAKQVMLQENLCTPVSITSYGDDTFVIQYGAEQHVVDSYADAVEQLGSCIMHSMVCAGNIEITL